MRKASLSIALTVALVSGALAEDEEAAPAETPPAEVTPTAPEEPGAAGPPPADATTTDAPADTGAAATAEVTPTAPAEPGAGEPPAAAESSAAVEKAPEVGAVLFEYSEDLWISGPGGAGEIHLKSNMLVAVTTEGDKITVEVDTPRLRTAQGDSPPGRIALMSSDTEADGWDIKPQTVVFSFRRTPRGMVSVKGPARDAANEAISVLSQGPYENTSTEGRNTKYEIELRSDGRDVKLAGVQSTEKLWVDWDLEDLEGKASGTFEVGNRGWELPMTFALPGDRLDKRGNVTISSIAGMRYSSDRQGPEADTTLDTTLTLKRKNDEYKYVRKSVLRPKGPLVEKPSEETKPSGPRAKGALAGGASAWARTATLATLGVQRLAGVRETGLAMWLAQAAIDSAAGRVVPRAADRPQRRTVKTVAKLSPRLEPPEGLLRDDLFSENWLVRFETGQSFMDTNSSAQNPVGKSDISSWNVIVVPNISLAVRRKFKKCWRLGGGLDVLLVRVDTGNPRVSWSSLGASGRVEYLAETWNVGLAAGTSFIRYEMDSSSRTASGSLRTPLMGLDLEKLLGKRWGLGVSIRFSGDLRTPGASGFGTAFGQLAARWYFAKNAALQTHVSVAYLFDGEAVGGILGSVGSGGGVGVTMRW